VKGWQLCLAAMLYVWAAIDYAKADDRAMCVAFVCYGIANLCFAWNQAGGWVAIAAFLRTS
jgi:hypothetical protein